MANDSDMMLVPTSPIGGADTVSDDNNSTSKGFSGTFNGNRYKIKNLNLSTGHNGVGFFGVLRNATVKNLALDSGYISGGWYTGSIAGYATGSVIEDCYSDITVCSVGGSKIGGIAGFITNGTKINRCANYGAVIVGHSSGNAGGISGQIGGSGNKIYSSYNRGMIVAHGAPAYTGGIFGYVASGVGCEIKNSYNAAHILGYSSKGAIFGSCSSSSNVSFSNTYFAQGFYTSTATKSSDSWGTSAGSGTIKSKSQSDMKTSSMASTLSSTDYTYSASLNGGYPVHKNATLAPGGAEGDSGNNNDNVPTKITLVSGSKLSLNGGIISGVPAGMSASSLKAQISNTSGITVGTVGTGCKVTLTVNGAVTDTVTILITGDVTGDGAVNGTDYIRIKSAFLKQLTLSGVYKTAADVDSNGSITTTDFMRIKSHFLKTYNLYA
jgi:hypothetical protein